MRYVMVGSLVYFGAVESTELFADKTTKIITDVAFTGNKDFTETFVTFIVKHMQLHNSITSALASYTRFGIF